MGFGKLISANSLQFFLLIFPTILYIFFYKKLYLKNSVMLRKGVSNIEEIKIHGKSQDFFRDGVHLNDEGYFKFFCSIRMCIGRYL